MDIDRMMAERDAVALRRELSDLEGREGVTDAHRLATRRLRERGALLRHPDVHRAELTSHALSPDGRYLAVGSRDAQEESGAIQIWELATGRCVNVLDDIYDGVGHPDYRDNIQWSADGRVLAAEYNMSAVGAWDPFGEQVDPPPGNVEVALDNGNPKPVGFALSPDGSRIFIHDSDLGGDSGVWASLAPLRRGGGEPIGMTGPRMEPSTAPHGATMHPSSSVFSGDGSRIWGFGEWRWEDHDRERLCGAFAIDAASRVPMWFVDSAFGGRRDRDRIAVSPDSAIMALNHGTRLAFIDADTGTTLAEAGMPFGSSYLRWGMHDGIPRLANVDATAAADTGVRVYDGTEHRHDLPVTPKAVDDEFPDGHPWTWSPDGTRAACLTARNRVEIWELRDEPRRLDTHDAPVDARGLWWGAGDVLVIGGPHSLRFVDLATGRDLGDFRFNREILKESPLWHKEVDHGIDLAVNPAFALDDETWAVAFAEGVLIAPGGRTSELDDLLAWSVDRRHAWPYRWGEPTVVPDVAAAIDHVSPESREVLEQLPDEDVDRVDRAAWTPSTSAGLEDLFDATIALVREHGRWNQRVINTLRVAARQRARLGQPDAAEALTEAIPNRAPRRARARALAEVALILAAAGHREPAARLHADAVAAAADIAEAEPPFTAAAIGAGYVALGEPRRAEEWLDRAEAAIDPEPRPWEHRLAVCWALLESGLEDRARALWEAEVDGAPFHNRGWLVHLVRIGRDDLVREFCYGPTKSWYDIIDAHYVFVMAGRADLLREYIAHDEPLDDEAAHLAAAERNADPDRPNLLDLRELNNAHDELLRTPSEDRLEAAQNLALQSAIRRHHGAVLDMLRQLPTGDFDAAAATAMSALWIALAGSDAEPW